MKKQFIIFVVLVAMLMIFNRFLMNGFDSNTTIINSQDLLNTEQVKPQKLFNSSWKIIKTNYIDSKLNGQNWNRWKNHYKGKIKTDEDANIAINTMIESLDDPYSRYLNKSNYAEQNTSINSKIYGIGVNITSESGRIKVVGVIEDTPAFRAGIKNNDIFLKVNNKDISGMKAQQVADLVRGPENTFVKLTLLRKGGIVIKSIQRKEIKIKTVKSSMQKDIGYIQIMSFIGNTTTNEFIEALKNTDKAKGLILDLRGNTGGLLPNAVCIANMFINNGNIVSIVGRSGYKKNIYAQNTSNVVKKPVLILVDGGSASASEIFSGALKDYHIAKLIGTKTFGKGMVQKIIPMPNETGLNLTIAKYLTPMGHDINKKGINPDVEIKLTEKDIYTRNDVQLKKAQTMMHNMIDKKQK